MPAAANLQEAPTLCSLARETLLAHDGDTAAATDALTARLQSNKPLLRSILASVIADAVNVRVEMEMRANRKAIIATADRRNNVVALATGIANSLLDFPLANGVKLRAATRDEVFEQAGRYGTQARDMTRKAKWLSAIADRVPEGKVVGDVITDADAKALWEGAAS